MGWGLGLAPGDRLVPLLLALVLAILWSLLEFEGSESEAMGLADPKWAGVTGVMPCPSGPWPPLRLICLCLLQPSSGLDQAIGGPLARSRTFSQPVPLALGTGPSRLLALAAGPWDPQGCQSAARQAEAIASMSWLGCLIRSWLSC